MDADPTCTRCGSSLGPNLAPADRCVRCRDESYHFDEVVRFGAYDGLLRDLVLRMKHSSGEAAAEALGSLWIRRDQDRFRALTPDLVVPVPLHWFRRLSRGYNQSEVVAIKLAEGIGRPFCSSLVRSRSTPMQTSLTPARRRENVRGAFRVKAGQRVRDLTVLLVDDVLTTGSTASHAAKALKGAGAKRVIAAAVAHG